MRNDTEVRIILDDIPLKQALNREVIFFNRVHDALVSRGVSVEFRRNSASERLSSFLFPGYSLFLMDPPLHDRALSMRKAYHVPFWRIENTANRWEFEVARTEFPEDKISSDEAASFCARRRKNLFQRENGRFRRSGHVCVPLQGKLLSKRSFQACSPIRMLEFVLEFEKYRPIFVTTHPGEVYTKREISILESFEERYKQINLLHGTPIEVLESSDYTVSQNSSICLNGFYFKKPCILFGKIDFHHIALNANSDTARSLFYDVQYFSPDFEKYLYWFFQRMAIRADAKGVEEIILRNLESKGWKL